ncbi:unnamed protein product [marine sediment metagenome]|uniref:Uncharacterized protein n=1 Tax=marine sediment metagenome TaxID=412755 RepID=X0TPN5_9ZZZZ
MKVQLTHEGNTHKKDIQPLSKLSVEDYVICFKADTFTNIDKYIGHSVGLSVEQLKQCSFNCSLATLQAVWDVSPVLGKQPMRKTIKILGKRYLVKDIPKILDAEYSYGRMDLIRVMANKLQNGNQNEIEAGCSAIVLNVYSLAVALCDYEKNNAEDIHNELIKMKWVDVLPIAFFLSRHIAKKGTRLSLLSRLCGLRFQIKAWLIKAMFRNSYKKSNQ